MAVLLITYDLENPRQNYSAFHNEIKHHFHIRLSESSYAICTNEPASYIYKKLKPSLGKDDYLYIITLSKPWAGYCPKKNKDWFTNYFYS